jgi:hypothetical protein
MELRLMRALTPVEAALLVSCAGSILAVVIPSFVRNVHASYVSEATSGVSTIAARAAALMDAAQATSALPDPAPLTPNSVPRGTRVTDPPGIWDHPTWKTLDFRFDAAHAYSFAFDAEKSAEAAKWTARGHGDLDGDGTQSTIQIDGTFRPGSAAQLSDMDVQNEIE